MVVRSMSVARDEVRRLSVAAAGSGLAHVSSGFPKFAYTFTSVRWTFD